MMAGTATFENVGQRVKIALSSPELCSDDTVELLRRLFDNSPKLKPKGQDSKGKKPPVKRRQAGVAKSNQVSKQPLHFEVAEISDDLDFTLDAKERFVFATELVNIVLQTLTIAGKAAALRGFTKDESNDKERPSGLSPTKCAKLGTSSKSAKGGLQSRSPNCSASRRESSNVWKVSPKKLVDRSLDHSGVRAVAGCGSIAFDCLKRQPSENASSLLQLEGGILAFISRLVSLGLTELAIRELEANKSHLIMLMRSSGTGDGATTRKVTKAKPANTEQHETLATLIDFGQVHVKNPALVHIINHQVLVLKLACAMKQSSVAEALYQHLGTSSLTSPINLLLNLSTLPGMEGRAATLLETVAQLILGLCRRSVGDCSADGKDHKAPLKVDTCFRLQALAFEAHVLWRNIARHRGDMDAEIWKPFQRCINAFTKSSPATANSYQLVLNAYKSLLDKVSIYLEHVSEVAAAHYCTQMDILLHLSHFAQKAGLWTESKSAAQDLFNLMNSIKCSQVRKSVAMLRLGVTSLNQGDLSSGSKDVQSTLDRAMKSLDFDMVATISDLSLLVRESTDLANAAMIFTTRLSLRPPQAKLESHCSVIQSCQSFLSKHLQLLSKCLRLYEVQQVRLIDSKINDFRIQIINTVRPSTESLIVWYKNKDVQNWIAWALQDATLQDCLSLLQLIETDEVIDTHEVKATSHGPISAHAKISHIYWSAYVTCKTSNSDSSMALLRLQRSCDCLRGRSALEMKSGSLPLKLMKLGQAYESIKDYDKSLESLHQSIHVSIQCGDLSRMEDVVESASFRSGLSQSAEADLLSQTVERFLHLSGRVNIKGSEKPQFYDDENLESSERSRILELQLNALSNNSSSTTLKLQAKKALPAICELLLVTYINDQNPGRRWKLALTLLRLSDDDSDLANHQVVKALEGEIINECLEPTRKDFRGWACLEHIRASLMVILAFRNPICCTERLKDALMIWTELALADESRNIEDNIGWRVQLQSVLVYFQMHNVPSIQLSVLRLILNAYEISGGQESNRGLIHTNLGILFLRLGCSEEAGIHLMKARALLHDAAPSLEYAVICHIAHVEYYFTLGNMEKSQEYMAQATAAGAFDMSASDLNSSLALETKVQAAARLSEHLQTKLQVDWMTKPYDEALYLAKRNVEIVQRAWKSIELHRPAQSNSPLEKNHSTDEDIETLSTAMSTMDMRSYVRNSSASLRGKDEPTLWRLAPIMLRSLIQASSMYWHYGLYQEAMHQLSQAHQVAETLGLKSLQGVILAKRGEYNYRSGSLVNGLRDLEKAGEICSEIENNTDLAQYYCSLGYSHHITGQWELELEDYNHAESILDAMNSPMSFKDFPLPTSRLGTPSDITTNLKIPSTVVVKQNVGRKLPATSKIRSKPVVVDSSQDHNGASLPHQKITSLNFPSIRTEITRRKAESALAQGDSHAFLEVTKNLNTITTSNEARAQQCGTLSKILVKLGLTQMSLDAIFSLLPESTITFPAVAISQSRRSSTHARAIVSPIKKSQKGTVARRAPKEDCGKLAAIADLLCQALNNLSDIRSTVVRNYSNTTISQMCAAFTNAAILLSFVQPEAIGKSIYPALVAYSIDLPQSIVSIRERAAASVDFAKQMNSNTPVVAETTLHEQYLSISSFQANAIDILPEPWTAVSLSLDESQEHIYLVKYQANKSPFTLRLPLTRQNAENSDQETFTFGEAKNEMTDIIRSSDATVHAAQENPDKMKTKGAKTSWWEEREALDERLKNLLVNMENVWLGGFRGILSQSPQIPYLLARFHQSFEVILDKYLPSRQNTRGRNEKEKVQLSPRIFELFVGLAFSADESMDLDEPLTDLLYYVVDILQFNGECNAYDEIDFDTMIVETQDAIHCYHEAIQAEDSISTPRHTILILDKQLHAFPWESMPCLEGQSVSRLSSLYDLRERVNFMKHQEQQYKQSSESPSPPLQPNSTGIIVSPISGTYILNPSSDLQKTQSRFQPGLSLLSHPTTSVTTPWTSITARAPTEEEFTTALTPSTSPSPANILLYFGHGSGAQYIRPRRIKRLAPLSRSSQRTTTTPQSTYTPPTCNTALLFGCSSASLHTPGEFNNYGPPVTYLAAGAPAVLGSLWDVTDGDCDVFAATTLEAWGLLAPGSCTEAGKSSGGGKAKARGREKGKAKVGDGRGEGRVVEEGERWGKLCLSEAVARARGRCYLKYLNGAAMVVYGVPVFVGR